MLTKRKFLDIGVGFINNALKLLPKTEQAKVGAALSSKVIPIVSKQTKYGTISFSCPGEIPVWRAMTLLTKEPETIEWIDTFEKNTVFWDIGANVGCYTLYAGQKNIEVLSFEPSAANYYVLCKNIELNNMDANVASYCIAFSDLSQIAYLNMSTLELGGAINSFGKPISEFLVFQENIKIEFRQGIVGFSVDDFIEFYNPKFPNYIKIDVDGIEDKIIKGATKTLKDNRVKSVLVELDDNDKDYCSKVINTLKESGLELISKKHSTMFDTGKYSSVYNNIFKRV
ncbi:methyltransferase FkbM domain protein [Candidatus Magnetobacterium bavaricum]|uniref:Methyltransferase FkbM domain protein n=1 Tax=Candidatus Magnetobacterium bavaricum TaxID=29290 RepID=A0A0F3GN17_9BACT|nr:methyltransferase FkbM domain protein [Candidatus Magnetobacterium bavaricum]